MSSTTPEFIPDVQNNVDQRQILIDQVGIKQVKYPLKVADGAGHHLATVGEWTLTVQLPATKKGTHMSRFMALLSAYRQQAFSVAVLEDMATTMLDKLEANQGQLEVSFTYFINKTAPVSGIQSLLDYQVTLQAYASREDGVKILKKVVVPVMTLCPCSKEISEYGAHNQRSHITVTLDQDGELALNELIQALEIQGSSQLWSMLKRPDEKYVTEFSYNNPKFVEDLIRDVALQVQKLPQVNYYKIEVENFESIHNHSAYAMLEGRAP
ncbi:GTP cyclohydrolase FolE2 [Brackiella oedipodis]|uniref:GTP cyclohydrolase FolE2 n=1 Tax=Brackiella oedipodis TaxID=124225 RepID=UPI00048EDD01|nr:GTP cyclohydrolase FolE2 [Brackiella oedipodis]